jgi:hypothetical protein
MERVRSSLTGFIIGETLGSIYNGMSRGHIHSHFRNTIGYPDPFDALKGHYERWRKPGLYGGIGQLSILEAIIGSVRPLDSDSIGRKIESFGKVLDVPSGVYREPGYFFEQYLAKIFRSEKTPNSEKIATAAIVPFAVGSSISMLSYACPSVVSFVSFVSECGADIAGAVGSAITARILHRFFVENGDDNIVDLACVESEILAQEVSGNQPELFNAGVNPDRILESALLFKDILLSIRGLKNLDEVEGKITQKLNSISKSPITRATVDLPYAILPFAFAIVDIEEKDPVYVSAKKGGNTAILASITGMLAGALHVDRSPGILIDDLINRKNLFDLFEKISLGESSFQDAERFFNDEIGLTKKEMEERHARLKHIRDENRHTKPINDREGNLTRHIVESWTKVDKARWKKERRTHNEED